MALILVFIVLILMAFFDCMVLGWESRAAGSSDANEGINALWITLIAAGIAFVILLVGEYATIGGTYRWVIGHPYHVLLGAAGYFGIGVTYSFLWLPGFVRDRYRRLMGLKEEWERRGKGAYCTFQ